MFCSLKKKFPTSLATLISSLEAFNFLGCVNCADMNEWLPGFACKTYPPNLERRHFSSSRVSVASAVWNFSGSLDISFELMRSRFFAGCSISALDWMPGGSAMMRVDA